MARMDFAWVAIFTIAAFVVPMQAVVQGLFFGNYSLRLLALFIILSASIILPFVMEVIAYVSKSARGRFRSWIMLVTSLVVVVVNYVFDALWLEPAGSRVSGIVSGLIIYFTVRYLVRGFGRFFLANLKSDAYRTQIPTFGPISGLGRDILAILVFYICVGVFVGLLFQ